MTDVLELEESELFDQEEDVDEVETAHVFKHSVPEEDDDNHSDSGVLGQFEDEDSLLSTKIPTPNRSSIDDEANHDPDQHTAIRAGELGTSLGGNSIVGSLKSFEPHSFGVRRAHSDSNITLAASVPARIQTPLTMPVTRSSSNINSSSDQEISSYYLGTSMPINITIPHRRGLSGTRPSLEGKKEFIPPHLLESALNTAITNAHADDDDTFLASGQSLNISPSVKREKLMARNAILRSTGFIEHVSGFAAPAVGDLIDAVKESKIAGSGGVVVPRRTATSSLTTMLGTST